MAKKRGGRKKKKRGGKNITRRKKQIQAYCFVQHFKAYDDLYEAKSILLSPNLPKTSFDIKKVHHYKDVKELTSVKTVEAREERFINAVIILRPTIIKKFYIRQVMKVILKSELSYNDYLVKSYINTGIYLRNDFEFAFFSYELRKKFFKKFMDFYLNKYKKKQKLYRH